MNILSTQYTLKYKSFEIVLAGCKGDNGIHCRECHSPETWDFNQGVNFEDNFEDIEKKFSVKIKENDHMIDWIWVYGGEPLDNNIGDLENFLIYLQHYNKPVLLFTRFEFEHVPKGIRECSDYIKCGAYIPKLKTEDNIQYGIKLATSNQRIYKKDIDW